MPRISVFFGIVIYMYHDDHAPPHFHALHEGLDAVFSLGGNLLQGTLSPKAKKLIKEWATLNKAELQENWERACSDMPLNWIKPLR